MPARFALYVDDEDESLAHVAVLETQGLGLIPVLHRSLDYSEIHASITIAVFQYSMMSYLNRQNSDEIRYGELFYRLQEEVRDAALFNALEIMLSLSVEPISEDFDLPVAALNESMNKVIKRCPKR